MPSSLPAITSASNCRSHASASNAENHSRNAASSSGWRALTCPSIRSTRLIKFSSTISAPANWPPGMLDGDRKSTRLNSSHLVISYAVFCFKQRGDSCHPNRIGPASPEEPDVCGECLCSNRGSGFCFFFLLSQPDFRYLSTLEALLSH